MLPSKDQSSDAFRARHAQPRMRRARLSAALAVLLAAACDAMRRMILLAMAAAVVARPSEAATAALHRRQRSRFPQLGLRAWPPHDLVADKASPPRPSRHLVFLCCMLAFVTDSNGAMGGAFLANHFVERGVSLTAIGTALGISSGVGLLGVAPLAPRLIRRVGALQLMLYSALVYAACRFAMAALAPVRNPRSLVRLAVIALTVQTCADALCDIAAVRRLVATARPAGGSAACWPRPLCHRP